MFSLKNGFLPDNDPCEFLTSTNVDYVSNIFILENLASTLTDLLESRHVREELVAKLRTLHNIDSFINSLDNVNLERLMLIFSYFASAYVHATHENQANYIPIEIGYPLNLCAKKLKRHPILSYASYCLTNWKRIDKSKPVELGNIKLLQNFTKEFSQDEDWFILVHVDIESKAKLAIDSISSFISGKNDFNAILSSIHKSFLEMNSTLKRMPEYCREDVYYKHVRPYIFGFNNILYEGVFTEPSTFRGETGAQSSIIPAIQTVLGVEHKESMLTKHLMEMREYMPKEHRDFLSTLEFHCKNYGNLREAAIYTNLKDVYNQCLEELIKFRKQHLEYAVNYIHAKVSNPTGTGGTPYVPWLSNLVKETEGFFIS